MLPLLSPAATVLPSGLNATETTPLLLAAVKVTVVVKVGIFTRPVGPFKSPTATVSPSGLTAAVSATVRPVAVAQPVVAMSHRQRSAPAMASVEPAGLKASDNTPLPL